MNESANNSLALTDREVVSLLEELFVDASIDINNKTLNQIYSEWLPEGNFLRVSAPGMQNLLIMVVEDLDYSWSNNPNGTISFPASLYPNLTNGTEQYYSQPGYIYRSPNSDIVLVILPYTSPDIALALTHQNPELRYRFIAGENLSEQQISQSTVSSANNNEVVSKQELNVQDFGEGDEVLFRDRVARILRKNSKPRLNSRGEKELSYQINFINLFPSEKVRTEYTAGQSELSLVSRNVTNR